MKPVMETKRVLVVEDNTDAIAIASAVLSHAGFLVIVVDDGGTACAAAAIHKPDVILLDLHLPNAGGTEIASELHADPRCTEIPIVVITADVAALNMAFTSNVRAVLLKPVQPRAIVESVLAVL